ncbi:MAG TPA: hypothetical protein VN894_03795, partial [Polyangiaceae bacterium]|nr:hypothetical protein [Polyangiaceae bacterium]
ALAARFGAYVDVDRPIVAGFSLGAAEVAQIAVADPARFSRVAQVEGGHSAWTPSAAGAFASHGGLRALFACGSAWCVGPARDAAVRLSKAGVGARTVHADVGHTTDRPLQEAIMRELQWFIGDDPRWAVTHEW